MTKKAKPVYAVQAYKALRLPGESLEFQVFPTSITKDGVELLDEAALTAASEAFEAALTALSEDEREAHKAWEAARAERETQDLTEEEAVAMEDAKLAALDIVKAARRDAKVAEAVAALSSEAPPAEAEPMDAVSAARWTVFRAMATDLGVTLDEESKKAFSPATKDARMVALKLVLRDAARSITTKAGAAISTENMAKLQTAHDALAMVTGGSLCPPKAGSGDGGMTQESLASETIESKSLDLDGLVAAIDGIKNILLADTESLGAKVIEAREEVERLETTIKSLKSMPLGRPTQANARVEADPAAATWADMASASGESGVAGEAEGHSPAAVAKSAAPLTEAELLAGTEVVYVRRGAAQMKMRKWPAGHGLGQRPALPDAIKPYMLMSDLINYREGGEALVPELSDN